MKVPDRLGRWVLAAAVGMLLIPRDSRAQQDSTLEGRMLWGIDAGMGVSLVNTSPVADYINSLTVTTARVEAFAAAAEFYGAFEVMVARDWNLKAEYAYLTKSFNMPEPYQPDVVFSYAVHVPTLSLHYVLPGRGYALKFGGGLGYLVGNFTEDYSYYATRYASHGVCIQLEGEGNTQFDEHLFGYIGLDARQAFMGDLKDDSGRTLINRSNGKNVSLSFFSVGVKFGLCYYF
jgi:hypothetical protein